MFTLCLCLCFCLCLLKSYDGFVGVKDIGFLVPAFHVFPINVNTLSFFLSLWLSLHFENVSCFVGVIPIGFLVPAFPAFPINVNTSHLTRNLARVECFVSTLMGDTSSNLLRHCFSLSHLFYFKLSLKSALSPFYFFPPLDHPMTTPKTILSSA